MKYAQNSVFFWGGGHVARGKLFMRVQVTWEREVPKSSQLFPFCLTYGGSKKHRGYHSEWTQLSEKPRQSHRSRESIPSAHPLPSHHWALDSKQHSNTTERIAHLEPGFGSLQRNLKTQETQKQTHERTLKPLTLVDVRNGKYSQTLSHRRLHAKDLDFFYLPCYVRLSTKD